MKKCVKCGKKAQVYLPQHRLSLCAEHYTEWYENRVERTIREFNMIKKEDRVLVAVSGGKDSLSLWQALNKLGYNADGLYINLGIGEYSQKSQKACEEFAKRWNRELHVVDLRSEILPIPELKEIDQRPACSVCGTVKRYYMNKVAREKGYNVLATGHNLDDESAVLFSNTLSWNVEYLRRQYPALPEGDGFVKKVKPLCKLSEKENALYAFLSSIDFVEEECPFAEGATSIDYKLYLSTLEEKMPGTKLRFYGEFLRRMYPILKESEERLTLQRCKICQEPSSSEICAVCRLKEKVYAKKSD